MKNSLIRYGFLIIIFCSNNIYINSQNIFINEFMSLNYSTIQDANGDYEDWIELYNAGISPVNLQNYKLSDDYNDLLKWIFPSIEILPDSFLLIFASGKDTILGNNLHTNFKIKSSGEPLILVDNYNIIIDYIDSIQLPSDISYGRYPDGSTGFAHIISPSPGFSNNNSSFLSILSFSHIGGYYTNPFELIIGANYSSDTIYYTIDGSIPTDTSFMYSTPINIDYKYNEPNVLSEIPTSPESIPDSWLHLWEPPLGIIFKGTVIRAVSYSQSIPTSHVYTCSYFVDSNIYSRYNYPVISLVTNSANFFDYDSGIYVPGVYLDSSDLCWTGNYFQRGIEWERNVHIEYFEQNGELKFAQDAGVRINGEKTRHAAQKSLRLYARSEYRNKYFNYNLFPQRNHEKYKRFILRTPCADNRNIFFKDAMTQNIVKALNLDILEYKPVIVFLNGEYWGVHNLREYLDKYYIAYCHNINEDSIDILSHNGIIVEGSNENYINILDFIENNDLSVQSNYEFIKTQIDIDNYINYQISEIFFDNYDWPGNNVKYWRRQIPGDKWKWLFFDLDNSFQDYTYNTLEHATVEGGSEWPNPDWSTFLFRNLLKNDEFQNQFIARFAVLLNTTFQTDLILNKIDEFENLYEPEIEEHIVRWNFPANFVSTWNYLVDINLREFAIERPCYMKIFIMTKFDLDEFDFDCDTGISDAINGFISVFPNPAKDYIWVCFKSDSTINSAEIDIYNILGAKTASYQLQLKKYNQERIIISNLSSGVYIIKLTINDKVFTTKLVVRN